MRSAYIRLMHMPHSLQAAFRSFLAPGRAGKIDNDSMRGLLFLQSKGKSRMIRFVPREIGLCLLALMLACPFLLGQSGCGSDDGSSAKMQVIQSIKSVVDTTYQDAQEARSNVTGILVGVKDDALGIDFSYAVGLADKDLPAPMSANRSFKIGSVTKTMTTTVVAQLIDEGKLAFDTPLSQFYPDLPESGNVTIEMLGNMTSGYFDYMGAEPFNNTYEIAYGYTTTPRKIIDTAMKEPPDFHPPGSDFSYSNTNTVLLGMIIEKITGNTLEDEFRTRLFQPLGLEKTGAKPTGTYLPQPKAHCYDLDRDEDWTEKFDYSLAYACGNAYSTLSDQMRWARALATGELVSNQTYRKIVGTYHEMSADNRYYFGMMGYKGYMGHSGFIYYYQAETYHDPASGRTIVILSNAEERITGALLEGIDACFP